MRKTTTSILRFPTRRLPRQAALACLSLAAYATFASLATVTAGCSREKSGSEAPASGSQAPASSAQPPAPSAPASPPPADPAATPPAAPPAAAPQSAVSPVMRPDRIDFTQPIEPITGTVPFSALAGRKLLIFYFGPTCPHCQASVPEVQAYAESLRGEGYEAIAIANQRSDVAEIREFIARFNCRLPVYWDKQRAFGEATGIQSLPTLFLVRPSAEFFKHTGFDGKATVDLLRAHD